MIGIIGRCEIRNMAGVAESRRACVSRRMAIIAGRPHMGACQRKFCRIVVDSGRLPCGSRMTECALGRESRLDVIGI